MSRALLLLAGAVAVGAALLLVLTGSDRHRGSSSPTAPLGERGQAGPVVDRSTLPIPDSDPESSPTNAGLEDEPRTEREPSHANVSGPILVTGRIVVEDEHGRVHAEESGTFTPVRWDRASGKVGPEVVVLRGRFELRIDAGHRLGFAGVELRGRKVKLEDVGPFVVTPGVELELRGRWRPTRELHVLDETYRQHLTDVLVVAGTRFWRAAGDHPGDYPPRAVLLEGATSPIPIPDLRLEEHGLMDRVPLWVTARGYRWALVRVDPMEFDDLEALLVPGCDLEVTLVGRPERWPEGREPTVLVREAPDPETWAFVPDLEEVMADLEARPESELPGGRRPSREEVEGWIAQLEAAAKDDRPDGIVVAERAAGDQDSIHIRGLEPGERIVSVEIGESYEDSRLVLGSAPVRLTAGSSVAVSVGIVEPPPMPEPVPLSGTLVLPVAWGIRHFSLELHAVDLPGLRWEDDLRIPSSEMTPLDGAPGTYRWETDEARPGKYRAKVDSLRRGIASRASPNEPLPSEFGFPDLIEVPPTGAAGVRLRVGEPADLLVEVVERRTGLPVVVRGWGVRWAPELTRLGSSGLLESAETVADGLCRMRVPEGPVVLMVDVTDYVPEHRRLVITQGENRVRIELKQACGVLVRFLENGRVVDADLHLYAVQVLGGPEGSRRYGWDLREGVHRVLLSESGTYELELPVIEGYRPIPPQEVTVPEDTVVRVDIRVERAP